MPKPSALRYGLIFSFTAVLFWGMLPIALKIAITFTDAITLTWIRFCVALLVTLALQWLFGALDGFKHLTTGEWTRLLLAGLCLIVNYNTFVWSLDYIHPGTAQLNFQVAPFYLAFGGIVFYGNRVSMLKWWCFAALAMGMVLFFQPQWQHQGESRSLFLGIAFVQVSAMAWSCYALLQKSLIEKLSPQNILLAIYVMGVLLMAPAADIESLRSIGTNDWWVVAFCCANTLIAYGAFAQAMKYMETVQISALVALTPVVAFLLTVACAALGWWQGIIGAPDISWVSLIGMVVVIISAISVQLIDEFPRRRVALASNPD